MQEKNYFKCIKFPKISILKLEAIEMNFLPRTDLAVEDSENEEKKKITEYEFNNVNIEKIVLDTDEARKYKKSEGVYYSITTDAIVDINHDEGSNVSMAIVKVLEDIYEEYNLTQDSYILILGLGNDEITPDSLGPKVVKNLFVTKHLFD